MLIEKPCLLGVVSLATSGSTLFSVNSRDVGDGRILKEVARVSCDDAIMEAPGRVSDAIWIQVGPEEVQQRKDQLPCCLIVVEKWILF